jgi:hypothetical protein
MRTFVLTILFVSSSNVYTQNSLYIPRNINDAYEKGTRTMSGSPGPNYWQNRADYKIKVQIEPPTRKLSGEETIIYYNQSPDTLDRIVFRLYQDFFRKGAARNFQISPEDLHDGVEIEELIINDKKVNLDNSTLVQRIRTNFIVNLDSSNFLFPNRFIKIEAKWNFTISRRSNIRMGTYDSTTFFIAYWYPQVAVYDDIDGWDVIPFNGEQEFYNDFNNYDVEITMPNNFLVWATGMLQNSDEVLSKDVYKKYEKALYSDSVVRIVSREDIENRNQLTIKKDLLTWHFKADNVPDFAFGTSDHYLWDASSMIIDQSTKRRSLIAAAYRIESKDFYDVADISREIIDYLSNELPGVPYPYPAMTVFNGQGGMEFPMMCNNSSSSSLAGTVGLSAHEIAHTYFPFYMGINEKKYAWMDEGFAVMLPFDLQEKMVENNDPRKRNMLGYKSFAGKEMEMPLMVPSNLLTASSYRVAAYARPAIAYDILRETLGKEKFDAALREYMKRWNGKHPIPYDFFFSFNDYLKEDLNWFWNPWFFESGYSDLGIKNAKVEGGKVKVVVEKVGKLPIPVSLKIIFDDESDLIIYKRADVWKNGVNEIMIEADILKNIKSITLGNSKIPDVNEENDKLVY